MGKECNLRRIGNKTAFCLQVSMIYKVYILYKIRHNLFDAEQQLSEIQNQKGLEKIVHTKTARIKNSKQRHRIN